MHFYILDKVLSNNLKFSFLAEEASKQKQNIDRYPKKAMKTLIVFKE